MYVLDGNAFDRYNDMTSILAILGFQCMPMPKIYLVLMSFIQLNIAPLNKLVWPKFDMKIVNFMYHCNQM